MSSFRFRATAAIIASLILACLHAGFVEAQTQQNRVRQRYNRVAKGANVAEWHKRLSSPEANVRLEAVESLGKDGTEASVEPLLEATADEDQRVRLKAFDYLGTIGSDRATPQLIQYLFLNNVDEAAKQRILVALGRIKDPRAVNPLVNFAKNTENEALLTAAIYACGEIGEARALPAIEALRDSTESEKVRRVASDAAAKINNKVVAGPNVQPTLIELEKRLRAQAAAQQRR